MIFDKLFKKDKDSGKSTETKPVSTVDYYAEGKTQFDAGHYTQAMEYFQAAIAEHPERENAYLMLAESYIKLNKAELSQKTLFSLLAINPNNKEALSKIQMMMGSLSKSKKTIEPTTNPKPSKQSIQNKEKTSFKVKPEETSQYIPNPNTVIESPQNVSDYIVIQPNINQTPYYCVEFKNGNRIYLEFVDGYCVVTPPNKKDGWLGYKTPSGELIIPDSIEIDGIKREIKKIAPYSLWCDASSIILPNTLVEIRENSFHAKIENLIIPNGVTYIGDWAFSGCEFLSSVVIPSSVTYLGKYAFNACVRLSKVVLSEGITHIEDHTFYGTSIEKIEIPSSVIEIGSRAFQNQQRKELPRKELKEIILKGAPPKIEQDSFCYAALCSKRPLVYVHNQFYQQYKYALYWQQMDLIPY